MHEERLDANASYIKGLIDGGVTQKQMAEIMCCTPYELRKWLKKNNIGKKKKYTKITPIKDTVSYPKPVCFVQPRAKKNKLFLNKRAYIFNASFCEYK